MLFLLAARTEAPSHNYSLVAAGPSAVGSEEIALVVYGRLSVREAVMHLVAGVGTIACHNVAVHGPVMLAAAEEMLLMREGKMVEVGMLVLISCATASLKDVSNIADY